MSNLRFLNLKKNDIFVSAKWQATVAAVKAYRAQKHLTVAQLPHEIVNHSKGEIVNSNGFTTNPIEAKWSVIKRWIRSRMSGRMPTHSNREKWRLLINEYQTRSILKCKAPESYDHGHIVTAQTLEILKLYCCD